jgi:hypothetical protein
MGNTLLRAPACRVDRWVRKHGRDEEGHNAHPTPTVASYNYQLIGIPLWDEIYSLCGLYLFHPGIKIQPG